MTPARRRLITFIFAVAISATRRISAVAVAAGVTAIATGAQVRIAATARAVVTAATIFTTGASPVTFGTRAVAAGTSAIAIRTTTITAGATTVTVRTSIVTARTRDITTGTVAVSGRAQIGSAAGTAIAIGAVAIAAARLYTARRFVVHYQRRTTLGATRQFFVIFGVTAFTNHTHPRKRSKVIKIRVNILHMNQHVVVNQLVRIRSKVHKDHVPRIRRHKKVAQAICRTLVQAPTHPGTTILGSRLRHIRKCFKEEVLT